MRIQKEFGKRTTHFEHEQEEKQKYILAYEGNRTEAQYFAGIAEFRSEIGISPLIDLIPLLRSVPQETVSHPKRIIMLLEEHLERYRSVKTMIDKVSDYCAEIGVLEQHKNYIRTNLSEDLATEFRDVLHLQLQDEIHNIEEAFQIVANFIERQFSIENQVELIARYIEDQEIVYNKDLDHVCIIVDRNIRNMGEEYLPFLEQCYQKNYRSIVTNPDFEFWLLLHSDKVFEFDPEKLLANQKVGRKRRYLEKVLSEVFDGYNKSKIRFERFLPHIRKAIENEKHFCEDTMQLATQLGSNVGILLTELILAK